MSRRRLTPEKGKEIVLDNSSQRLQYYGPDTREVAKFKQQQQNLQPPVSNILQLVANLYKGYKKAKENKVTLPLPSTRGSSSQPPKPEPYLEYKPRIVEATTTPDPKRPIGISVDPSGFFNFASTLFGDLFGGEQPKNKKEENQLIIKAAEYLSNSDYSKIRKMRNNKMSQPRGFGGGSRTVSRAPVAKSIRVRQSNKPRFSSNNGNIVIAHSELIGTITAGSAGTFTCKSYVINPGKVDMFSWLSTIAGNYDKYRLRRLNVSFISCKPTSTAGKVGLGIDYDSTDPVPTDRGEFYTLTHHVECAPWDSISFSPPLQGGVKFVNSHTVTDSKLIDYGQILVFSDQLAAADYSTILGDIIVDYEVELIDAQQATFETMNVKYENAATTLVPDSSQPIVCGPAVAAYRTASTSTLSYYLYEGYYLVTAAAHDDTGGSPTLTLSKSTGVTGWKSYGTSATVASMSAWLKVVGDGQYITWAVGTVAVTDLELSMFSFTRISSTVYNNASGTAA